MLQAGYLKQRFDRLMRKAGLQLVSVVLLLSIHPAAAAAALNLTESDDVYPLDGSQVHILEDPTAQLTISDVTSHRFAGAFRPSHQSIPNFGLNQSAYWFRFSIDGHSRRNIQWVLFLDQPLIDEVDLYIPRGDGTFEVKSSGDGRPMRLREIRDRNIAVPLPISGETTTYYLRSWIPGRAQFPLSVMTEEAFRRKAAADQALFTACAGFMIAMAIVGLAIFANVQDTSYLYFSLYILSSLVVVASVTGFYYAWCLPADPVLCHQSQLLFFLTMIHTGLLFTRTFLKLHETAPALDKLLMWLTVLTPLLLPLSLWLPPLTFKCIANVTYLAATICSVAAAVAAFRRGFAPARYFLFSRLAVYLGALSIALINFGLFPVELLSGRLLFLLPVLDAGFIALALADRVKMQTQQISGLVSDLRQEVRDREAAHRDLEAEMHARLRLEREVVRVSDDERIKISRELHDGLCQQLTGARLLCSALEGILGARIDELKVLTPLKQLLAEAGQHAYELSRGAWPMEHDPQGQQHSLEELTEKMADQSGIPIEYRESRNCPTCANAYLTHIYRIAQEALVNAVRHAHARKITVQLTCHQESGVRLEVADDGIGRGGQKEKSPGGMGLRIMAHRARIIGGALEISDAVPGRGTVVVCKAPCAAGQEGSAS